MQNNELLVKKLQKSNLKIVLAITGGGSEVIGTLLKFGGGSQYLIEAIVPYDQSALTKFLGKSPEKYCSGETACKMAAASLDIAIKNEAKIDVNEKTLMGVGMTCSLKKEEERAGREHWTHIAICTLKETKCYSFLLNSRNSMFSSYETKNVRLRQERQASELLLRVITESSLKKYIKKEKIRKYSEDSEYVDDIADNNILRNFSFEYDLIYPGSFDPMHSSHKEIAKAAAQLTNKKVAMEISISNVDKPRIDLISASKRINAIKETTFNRNTFESDILCVLTDAPLFKDKVKLFKNSTFIIGYDTYNRLTKSIEKGETLLEDLEGVKFLVFHRSGYEINKISELSLQCEFVSHEIYYDHDSVSSTKIRNEKKQ